MDRIGNRRTGIRKSANVGRRDGTVGRRIIARKSRGSMRVGLRNMRGGDD